MWRPKASVIVPSWNSSSTIAECIQSVKRQTEQNFECIIVDDGSEDGTIEAAKLAIDGDKRFRIHEGTHLGLSDARNIGIALASSDIAMHLDSDDLALPEMVETASKFLIENDLDIAFFNADVQNIGMNQFSFGCEREYFQRRKCYGISSGASMLKEMLQNGDYVYATFLQASRKSRIRRPFLSGIQAQDEVCTTENLVLAERAGHIDRTLYIKRCGSESASCSRNLAKWAWSRWKAAHELMKFADEEKIERPEILLPIIGRMIMQVGDAMHSMKQKDISWLNSLTFEDRTMLCSIACHTALGCKYFQNL